MLLFFSLKRVTLWPPRIPWPLSLTHISDGTEKATLVKLWLKFSEFLMLQTMHLNIPSIRVLGIFFFFNALRSWTYFEPNVSSPKLLCLLLKPKATSNFIGPNHAYITPSDSKCLWGQRSRAGAAGSRAQGTFCPARWCCLGRVHVCVCFSPLKFKNSSFCSSCQRRRRRRRKKSAIISVLGPDQELQVLREYFPKLGIRAGVSKLQEIRDWICVISRGPVSWLVPQRWCLFFFFLWSLYTPWLGAYSMPVLLFLILFLHHR